jgi:hypothetical protein
VKAVQVGQRRHSLIAVRVCHFVQLFTSSCNFLTQHNTSRDATQRNVCNTTQRKQCNVTERNATQHARTHTDVEHPRIVEAVEASRRAADSAKEQSQLSSQTAIVATEMASRADEAAEAARDMAWHAVGEWAMFKSLHGITLEDDTVSETRSRAGSWNKRHQRRGHHHRHHTGTSASGSVSSRSKGDDGVSIDSLLIDTPFDSVVPLNGHASSGTSEGLGDSAVLRARGEGRHWSEHRRLRNRSGSGSRPDRTASASSNSDGSEQHTNMWQWVVVTVVILACFIFYEDLFV